MTDNNKRKKTSLENALHVLKLFSMDEPELSVTSISHKLNVSKSTAHRLLSSLAQEGFVFKDPQSNLYSLGSSILSLVQIVSSQIHIANESIPVLNMLVEAIGENAHLAIIEGLDAVYLQTIDGEYSSIDYVHLGNRLPACCTSAGQAILAYHQEAAEEASRHLKRYTQHTIVKPDLFFEKLRKIREQGYSFCAEEYQDNVTGIGAPVFDEAGNVIASISITANSRRVISSRIQKRYVTLIHQAADQLTEIIKLRKGSNILHD